MPSSRFDKNWRPPDKTPFSDQERSLIFFHPAVYLGDLLTWRTEGTVRIAQMFYPANDRNVPILFCHRQPEVDSLSRLSPGAPISCLDYGLRCTGRLCPHFAAPSFPEGRLLQLAMSREQARIMIEGIRRASGDPRESTRFASLTFLSTPVPPVRHEHREPDGNGPRRAIHPRNPCDNHFHIAARCSADPDEESVPDCGGQSEG
jgi:hypothetical protein